MRFRKGDQVRLKTGHTRMQVTHVDHEDNTIRACYINRATNTVDPDLSQYWRNAKDYVFWDGIKNAYTISKPYVHRNNRNRVVDETHLFKTKTGKIGTFITTEQDGNIILRMNNKKNSLQSFHPSELEEIIPYTFLAQTPNGLYKCHYKCVKGLVNLNDVLQCDSGNIYIVKELDTKAYNYKSEFKGKRLVTEPLT